MRIVDHIDLMMVEPEGDILILDREFQLANASYQNPATGGNVNG